MLTWQWCFSFNYTSLKDPTGFYGNFALFPGLLALSDLGNTRMILISGCFATLLLHLSSENLCYFR